MPTQTFLEQAPKLIPVLTDPISNIIQIVLAVITGLAVLVALFQEVIKDYFNKAKLVPTISPKPPDCHQIELHNSQNGQYVSRVIYVRIRVEHTKGKTANNVEIILSKVEKKNEKSKWTEVKEFLPMNLKWSHTHTQTVTLPPSSFRHCDLGSFGQYNGQIVNQFLIDTIVQPNPVANGKIPNLLSPGKYKFHILLTGENVKPVIKSWTIDFSPSWSNDEDEMLKKYIEIKEAL